MMGSFGDNLTARTVRQSHSGGDVISGAAVMTWGQSLRIRASVK